MPADEFIAAGAFFSQQQAMGWAGYLQGQQPLRLPDAVFGQADGAPAAMMVIPIRYLETEPMVAVTAQAGRRRTGQASQASLIMACQPG